MSIRSYSKSFDSDIFLRPYFESRQEGDLRIALMVIGSSEGSAQYYTYIKMILKMVESSQRRRMLANSFYCEVSVADDI